MPSVISRDFRSEAQDAKRARENKQKWSRGTRPLGDAYPKSCSPIFCDHDHSNDSTRVRPMKPWDYYSVKTQNVSKTLRVMSQVGMPGRRYRANLDAKVQVADPSNQTDYLAEDSIDWTDGRSVLDGVLYSFDNQVTPGPLSLDVFIKENPRATRAAERHVESEYEIIDGNGRAIEGRRARNMLRRQNNTPSEEHSELARDDDGFELI